MKLLLNVKDVQNLCDVSKWKAYELIRDVNSEMKEKGFMTIQGRVNKDYLLERLGLKGE